MYIYIFFFLTLSLPNTIPVSSRAGPSCHHENDVAESFAVPFSGLSLSPDTFITILAKLAGGCVFRAGENDPLDTQESRYLSSSRPQKHFSIFTLDLCLGKGKHTVPTLNTLANILPIVM